MIGHVREIRKSCLGQIHSVQWGGGGRRSRPRKKMAVVRRGFAAPYHSQCAACACLAQKRGVWQLSPSHRVSSVNKGEGIMGRIDKMYAATVTVTGGREGHAVSHDGVLDVQLHR